MGGAQGDNFQLNVIDSLTNETMLTATTVVRTYSLVLSIGYSSVCRLLALARIVPSRHQLGRWPRVRQPVPYFGRQLLPLRLHGYGPGRHVLVPQPLVDTVLRRPPRPDGYLRPR